MGRELFLMKTARRFMMQINDKDYDEMIKKMKEIGFESVAERDGDMDFQYKILKKIIMTPSLYISQLPYLLTAFIKSLLTS